MLPHLPYPPTLLTRQTALELARDASRFAAAQNIDTDPPATEANLINSFSDYRAHADGRVSEAAQIAADWADAHHIAHSRLLLGEFGAMQSRDDTAQDQASRLRFLRAKALSAQSLGIGWAVWSCFGSFDISDGMVNRRPDGAVCQAIGLLCR